MVVEKKDEQGNITQTKEIYPVFVGPESYKSLTNDPRWIEYQKALAQSGDSNWIKGYSGRWHNLVIIEVGSYISEYLGIAKSSFRVSPGLKFKLNGKPYRDKGVIYSDAMEMRKKAEEVFGMKGEER